MTFILKTTITLILLYSVVINAYADERVEVCEPEKTYVIGVQAMDYTPHYNFLDKNIPSFFALFLNWVEQKTIVILR